MRSIENRTLFLLTVGMLEEHGPHLPIGADTIGVKYEARGDAGHRREPAPPTVRDCEAWRVAGMTDLMLQAVRGEDLFNRPRWPAPVQADPAYPQVVEDILEPERKFELALKRWMSQRNAPR